MSRKLLTIAAVGVLTLANGFNGSGEALAADLAVNTNVSNTCSLNSGGISFGTYLSGQSDLLDVDGSIGYQCSAGLDVDFELDGGSSNNIAGRLMGLSNSVPLQYQLFSDASRSSIWGTQTSSQEVNVDPTVAGSQTLPIFASILAGQSPSVTETYSDTVVFSFVVNP